MRCHSVACGMASRPQTANAIGCAKFYSRAHNVVIRVFDEVGNVLTRSLRGRLRYLPDLRPIAGKMSAYLFLIFAN
jgi:hypothetical protein